MCFLHTLFIFVHIMLHNEIFNITSEEEFNTVALKVFRHQYVNNLVYRRFCNLLGVSKSSITTCNQIPYLPISFFKKEKITCSPNINEQLIFTSSGTTGQSTSKHFVNDINIYKNSFNKGFNYFYGNVTKYCIIALLPSYLEREGSSLIYMVDSLIKQSKHPKSDFYLDDIKKLISTLKKLEQQKQPTLLFGVSFALLDLVEKHKFNLKYTTIIETGGMKGRRKELIRSELHQKLSLGFGTKLIHSEYGMTELLSQAYSLGNGVFKCPPWMKITIRDTEDPTKFIQEKKTGGINIIDLANINSCSFIATQDLGKKLNSTDFEVLGRFDNSDIRGCNLMVF